ncbi:hypothetical protein [Streptomyces olivaceoviridis]|uniref:hypothetical protein n=1 Tax=Streptomyces olivaceoviridis TaxID=1921 RepID=UPI00332D026F
MCRPAAGTAPQPSGGRHRAGSAHRARLEELLRAYGPGSRPASRGRYALIEQPETLVILERMETNPFGLRGQWEKKLETVFLDDLEFA